jgi:hypothetical protein
MLLLLLQDVENWSSRKCSLVVRNWPRKRKKVIIRRISRRVEWEQESRKEFVTIIFHPRRQQNWGRRRRRRRSEDGLGEGGGWARQAGR